MGKVVASKAEGFVEGDAVANFSGWQEYAVINSKTARKVDATLGLPLSAHIGVLGMTGMTAYFGFLDICNPKAGETVLVSAAAGAVGSLVGQIAKIKGCHVVGSTSSDEKCAFLKELGYDETINYSTTGDLNAAITAAFPKGIDSYFDNVGGETLDIAVNLLNKYGRVSLCGAISHYDNLGGALPRGPNLTQCIGKEVKLQGFIISSYHARFPEGVRQMAEWLKEGKLKFRETVYHGFEKVPEAFIALFEGSNLGKIVVKV